MVQGWYIRQNIKNKLSLILLSSILIVVTILGVYFDHFLSERYFHKAQEQISHAFHRFSLNLSVVEQELKKGIAFSQEDESLLASIELINRYQDKTDYDAILLDEEKKSIAEQLLYRVKLSLNNDIVLFDQNEDLMVYVMKTPKGYRLNYVSYENALPVVYSRLERETEYHRVPLVIHPLTPMKHRAYYNTKEQKLLGAGVITCHVYNSELVVKSHRSLFESHESERLIAHIEMSRTIGAAYFKSLSEDLDMNVFGTSNFIYGKRSVPLRDEATSKKEMIEEKDDYVSALSVDTADKPYYIVVSLKKSFLSATLQDNRQTFFFLIAVLTLLSLILLRFLFNRSIATPLQKVMGQINKIEHQDYSQSSIVRTGDELEMISKNVNQLARTIFERENALQESQKQLEYLSNTDSLTDLPNRRLFNAHLQHALDLAQRNQEKIAVLFLDLDGFKEINDTLGHEVGDDLLQKVALRIKESLRSSDTLARIGGDEFNILIEGIQNTIQVASIAQKIIDNFKDPFACDESDLYTTVSIGIALFPDDGEDTVTLIKYADLAMYKSKNSGRNRYSFFSQEFSKYLEERTRCNHALKLAIEAKNEFYLLYQPKISATSGKAVALEALIRWNSPVLGMVYPDRFIPVAEESGLIIPIGAWVLEQACRDFMILKGEGYRFEHISVNVSSMQLQKSDMVATLKSTLEKTLIDPAQLEIEITESYIATEQAKGLATLQSIREMGISLAIDDFGTGYSSLSYLQKLPVTRLKIDKSFVDDLPHSQEGTAVAKAIIVLAKTFNLAITAEGVENEEQLLFLQQEQCDEIQGYYYSKPLDLNTLKAYCLHACIENITAE